MKYSATVQKLVDKAERAEKSKRGSGSAGKARAKRTRAPADKDAARELELWIDNTSHLSPWGPSGQGKAIATNLARKMRAGKYDKAKAPKAWSYLVTTAAKHYVKEFGGSMGATFNPATRDAVAEALARDFEARFRAGDWTA